jgi:hypothetical protein
MFKSSKEAEAYAKQVSKASYLLWLWRGGGVERDGVQQLEPG